MRRLDIATIDLLWLQRVDPGTPIDDTVAAMARLVERDLDAAVLWSGRDSPARP